MAWPIDEDLSPVRRRLADYAVRHQLSEQPDHRPVEVAAGHVGLSLDHLAVATAEALQTEAEYVAAFRKVQAARQSGVTLLEGDRLDEWERSRRGYFLLHYKIDTLYVWARTLLDDVAALLNEALPRSQGSQVGQSHKGVVKNLESVATNEGVAGWEPVASRAIDLAERVKYFRDHFVIHRSHLEPRALRSMTMSPDGAARMGVGGLIYPEAGQEPTEVSSEDPQTLRADLESYVDAVLDFLEPLVPADPRTRRSRG